MMKRTGKCQCGQVRYECIGEINYIYICHCLECQKQSASAFAISVKVPRIGFRVTEGTPKFWTRDTDAGNKTKCAFCPNCGTRLWHETSGKPDLISIKGGSLDQPIDVSAAIHIWTSRKIPGIIIPEGAQQYSEQPP